MNSLKGLAIAASVAAFSSTALAQEDQKLPELNHEIDTQLCLDEPLILKDENSEDLAAWMQTMGAAFNMQVQLFMSAKDPSLHFIISSDPMYGVLIRMHKGDSSCHISPDTLMDFKPVKYAPTHTA
jgi:hypothetical protein